MKTKRQQLQSYFNAWSTAFAAARNPRNMKDSQICIQLEQLAKHVETAINSESDVDRNCRLQNVKEHLRRAWHEAHGTPCDFNDLITNTTPCN